MTVAEWSEDRAPDAEDEAVARSLVARTDDVALAVASRAWSVLAWRLLDQGDAPAAWHAATRAEDLEQASFLHQGGPCRRRSPPPLTRAFRRAREQTGARPCRWWRSGARAGTWCARAARWRCTRSTRA